MENLIQPISMFNRYKHMWNIMNTIIILHPKFNNNGLSFYLEPHISLLNDFDNIALTYERLLFDYDFLLKFNEDIFSIENKNRKIIVDYE